MGGHFQNFFDWEPQTLIIVSNEIYLRLLRNPP